MKAVIEIADDLLLTIQQELQLVSELIKSAEEKEAVLTVADVERLNEVLEKEEDVVIALRAKEEERKVTAEALASALFIPEKDVQLKKLIEHIDDPHCKERLSNAKDKIVNATERLSFHNAKVKELLNYQIDYSDFMLHLLYVPQSTNNFYNMQGSAEGQTENLSRLDYHA